MASPAPSAVSESTPLIPPSPSARSRPQPTPRPPRSVTFNPTVTSASPNATASPLRPSAQLPPLVSPRLTRQDTGLPTASGQLAGAGLQQGYQTVPSHPHGPGYGTAAQQHLHPSHAPMLSALNSKLRRRNSSGSALTPSSTMGPAVPSVKIGPQRTTRTAQKLKLLPSPADAEAVGKVVGAPATVSGDEESDGGRDVYTQFTRITDPTARRDAARLGKADRDRLPRVTAYCTAASYQTDELVRYLKGKGKLRGAQPKLFDECVYTPWRYGKPPGARERSGSGSSAGDWGSLSDWEREERRRERVPSPTLAAALSTPFVQAGGATGQERRFSDSAVEVENHNEQRRDDLIDLHASGGGGTGAPSGLVAASPRPTSQAISSPPGLRQSQPLSPPTAPQFQPLPPPATPPMQPLSPPAPAAGIRSSEAANFDVEVHTPEVFLFNYGTVVIWGMTRSQEQKFLKEITKFEVEKLAKDDIQTEDFNFYYTREYQARIYNDFISLRDKKNYMTKLAISHALAQSVKTSLYEDLVDNTIEVTKEIPSQIAMTGKVNLTRRQINMQIGELFILRINIHLQGSVLDAPELMWAEPQLDPVYQAVRSYLEMDQRVGLLTERLDVIADLLAVLKDQLSASHGEYLEWIVIVLIAVEILVAAINIVVDLYAGVD